MMKKSLSLLIGVGALICFSSPTWAMQCRDLLTNIEQVDKEFLLRSDVNARDKNGYTPLMWASMYGRADAVKLLLRHEEIDVNAVGWYGLTALMWASLEDTPV